MFAHFRCRWSSSAAPASPITLGRGLLAFVASCVVLTGVGSLGAEEKKGEASSAADSRPETAEPVPSSAVTDRDIIRFIDEQIRKGWADAQIGPSQAATDNE